MATIKAICMSEKKGTEKISISKGELVENHGLKGDAHAGEWHRQLSLLAYEKVEAFNKKGANVGHGAFGENLVIEGIDLATLPVGTRLEINRSIELEVTQIGKKCHKHCTIYHSVGDCIMPREGIFARVLKGGIVKPGDEIIITRYGDNQ